VKILFGKNLIGFEDKGLPLRAFIKSVLIESNLLLSHLAVLLSEPINADCKSSVFLKNGLLSKKVRFCAANPPPGSNACGQIYCWGKPCGTIEPITSFVHNLTSL